MTQAGSPSLRIALLPLHCLSRAARRPTRLTFGAAVTNAAIGNDAADQRPGSHSRRASQTSPTKVSNSLARIVVCFCFWPVFVSAKHKPDSPIVEIKCLVPEDNVSEFSKKVDLESKVPLTRVVCFFDTESLSLFQHEPKIILRSRYDSSNETDTTVKIRDGKVQGKDVECEFDKVPGRKRFMSCSVLNKGQEETQIKKANAGKGVKKIFSKQQEATLEDAFGKVDWGDLRPYGPVKGIKVWKKIKLLGGPNLTVERWKLPARSGKPARVLFEVSAKVPLTEEAKISKWIAGLVGISERRSDQEETKTRIVLEHFRSPTSH
jgi:hypothetical protein